MESGTDSEDYFNKAISESALVLDNPHVFDAANSMFYT
jgi:hypothetical protein